MRHETIFLKEKGSMPYARLITYLWDWSPDIWIDKRPMVLICPGGGYEKTSDREAEGVALKIASMGFHTAILHYSVAPAEYPTAMLEVAKAICTFREHAEEWRIDTNKIVVMGFSAGAHLAASYGVFWNESWLSELAQSETEQLRPNALLLGYPVITSDPEYWHEGSFRNLLGTQWSDSMKEKLSLEKQIGRHTPKTFLWHTFEDQVVPVENSIMWVREMCRHGISVEFHLYEKGPHGLSLANEVTDNNAQIRHQKECQSWIDLAEVWLKNL